MVLSNKKINERVNTAQQHKIIISNFNLLIEKNIIRIAAQEIFLYPQIWKNKANAINWIKCAFIYCSLKKMIKKDEHIDFIDINTQNKLAQIKNNKVKIFIDLPTNN